MIRRLELKDTDKLKELLDKVTMDLLDRGIPQWQYPWDITFLIEEINQNDVFGLFKNEELIGSFSMKKIERGYYFYRLAISPYFRGNGETKNIMDFLNQHYPKQTEIYLDCYYKNEKLKTLYTALGFVYIKDLPEEDYYVSVFHYQTKRGEKKHGDSGN